MFSGPGNPNFTTDFLFSSLDSRKLHLILLPTEECNFRCYYCYEDFRLKRMSPGVFNGLKALLGRRAPDLRELTLSFFGGEPLLARAGILDLLQFVKRIQDRHPRIQFQSDITTNGYLLSESLSRKLLNLGVDQYQISFDGPKEDHDRKRVLKKGLGTFDRIWKNLKGMKNQKDGFSILVRLHVDRENLPNIPRFVSKFWDEFGDDPRFKIFFRPISRFGGPNDSKLSTFTSKEFKDILPELAAGLPESRVENFAMEANEQVCYAAEGNSFVIRADGRINKCTIALENPENQIGRLRPDGTVDIDPLKMGKWMRGFFTGRKRHLKCPMKGIERARTPEPFIPDPPSPTPGSRSKSASLPVIS